MFCETSPVMVLPRLVAYRAKNSLEMVLPISLRLAGRHKSLEGLASDQDLASNINHAGICRGRRGCFSW